MPVQKPDKKFRGVIVPMVTPLTQELIIDKHAVERILLNFLKADVSSFLLGTTGESVSISDAQKLLLVKTTTSFVRSKVKVYAGITGNCLQESVENGKKYSDLGVDAVVSHLPFYFPLSDDQMIRYFEALADRVPCPLILYNNPITTHYSIPLSVIEKVSYHPNIYGFKDSERGIDRLNEALRLWSGRADFSHLLGWAAQSAYAMLNGCDGIVPSTGNLVPQIYQDLYLSALAGDSDKAFLLQGKTDRISDICQKGRILSQSLPALKVMMSVYGLCDPYVMPPLYSLTREDEEEIRRNTKAFFECKIVNDYK